MAFLCPVRIRRGKKKKNQDADDGLTRPGSGLGLNHGMGRITGSASIETLVRVGIEKEIGLSPDSKMVVLHNFVPCVDDELEVKRGQIVNILYRENDWVYVIGQDTRSEGFIPHSYCAPYNTAVADMAIKKKLPREVSLDHAELPPDGLTTAEVAEENSLGLQGSLKNSQASLTTSEPDFFSKDPSGRFIVLYTFIARDENDVSVERGEFVTVLNREDPEWYWVVRSDGSEGFIPSGFVFVYPAENILQASKNGTTTNSTTTPLNQHTSSNLSTTNNNNTNSLTFQQQQQPGADDLRYHGTELVMLYDYKAQAPDDLSVRRGDWIYADLNNQTVEGWLWAYSPKTRKYGFIPKAYARPPAMTSL